MAVDLAGASLPDEPEGSDAAVSQPDLNAVAQVPELAVVETQTAEIPEAEPEPEPEVAVTVVEQPEPEASEPELAVTVVEEPETVSEPEPEDGPVESTIPSPGEPRVVHRPRIVSVEVSAVGPDRVEVKLADGRLGVIPVADFAGRSPAVGEVLDAALLARSDPKRTWLSRSWAVKVQAWERLVKAKEEKRSISATVLRLVKGGAVADVEGQRAFLPSSLADDHAVDLGALVGTIVDVTVIDLDEAADRIVVSRRDALRRQRRQEQRQVLGSLAVGQRTTGKVVGLRDFGVQVDLGGGIRGLVHRTELSWNRVGSITEVVRVGDEVEAVVTEVQRGKRRVSLSIRQITPDPMLAVEIGALSQAEITRIVEYGAFARLEDSSIEGLIHQSELSELPGARADELVAPGDVVWVKVIDIDVPRRRIGLSVRQALLS